jgi:hypothetical protein
VGSETLRRRSAGLVWTFVAAGIVVVLVGVYLAGGQELTCIGVPTRPAGRGSDTGGGGVADCRLLTRRWLGRTVVGNSSYRGITRVETVTVRQTGEDAEDQWFVALFAGDEEAGRILAAREQAKAARDRLHEWLERGSRGAVRVEWSSWPFGYAAIAFGLVCLAVLTPALRANRRA